MRHRPLRILVAGVAATMLAGTASASASLIVTSQDDIDDGTCDAPHCSLREAILAANATAGPDQIRFSDDEPITPSTELPATTRTTFITSSATGRCDSDSAPLHLGGRGADFSQPGGRRPRVRPGADRRTHAGGAQRDQRQRPGAVEAAVGGAQAGAGNVIAGQLIGVESVGPVGGFSVQGNLIGLAPDGTTAIATQVGARVGEDTTGARIGGTQDGAGNHGDQRADRDRGGVSGGRFARVSRA